MHEGHLDISQMCEINILSFHNILLCTPILQHFKIAGKVNSKSENFQVMTSRFKLKFVMNLKPNHSIFM